MADESERPPFPAAPPPGGEPPTPPPSADDVGRDRGLSDMFRRAVAAGLEAAGRSKDDFVRIASTEIRGWLDHLELDTELRKALSKMVLEVKAEIRFRQADDGSLVSETESDMRIRTPGKPER